MFDLHYDLLSFCYVCYLKDDYTFLEEWKKNYRIDNVRGVVANLYFMSIPEMKEELHPSYYRKESWVICEKVFSPFKELINNYGIELKSNK